MRPLLQLAPLHQLQPRTARVRPAARGRAWTLYRGDALRVLPGLATASCDGVVTDPPYSSGATLSKDRVRGGNLKYTKHRVYPEMAGETRDQLSYTAWLTLWLLECYRVVRPGSPICVFSDWRQLPATVTALQAAGITYRGIVSWDKTAQARPQRGRFTAQAEFLAWGSAGAMPVDRGVGCLPGAFTVPVPIRTKQHVAEKPVALMRQLVRIVAPGGTILDPFTGSGSTGVAALHEGYRFIGVETTAAYSTLTYNRLCDATRTATGAGTPLATVRLPR